MSDVIAQICAFSPRVCRNKIERKFLVPSFCGAEGGRKIRPFDSRHCEMSSCVPSLSSRVTEVRFPSTERALRYRGILPTVLIPFLYHHFSHIIVTTFLTSHFALRCHTPSFISVTIKPTRSSCSRLSIKMHPLLSYILFRYFLFSR